MGELPIAPFALKSNFRNTCTFEGIQIRSHGNSFVLNEHDKLFKNESFVNLLIKKKTHICCRRGHVRRETVCGRSASKIDHFGKVQCLANVRRPNEQIVSHVRLADLTPFQMSFERFIQNSHLTTLGTKLVKLREQTTPSKRARLSMKTCVLNRFPN